MNKIEVQASIAADAAWWEMQANIAEREGTSLFFMGVVIGLRMALHHVSDYSAPEQPKVDA